MNAITIQPSRMPIPQAVAKEFEIQPAEWRVLVEQIFPAAKSVESVMMALAYCRKRNLDIFKKPVHIVPMWSTAKRAMVETVWPGIAEIRTTASRTGQYAGIDEVEFGPMVERTFTGQTGGNNSDTITKKVRFPEWASVVVYRIVAGEKCAYHAKVFWEETYATMGKSDVPNDMWAKRPRGQLDKCVEAAALRKAFPEELGNTYAAEEMEGRTIDGVVETSTPKPPAPPAPPPAASKKPEAEDAEVVEIETGEVSGDPAQVEGDFVLGDFLEQLRSSLDLQTDEAGVEEIWTEFDPESTLETKGHGDMVMVARTMREKRLAAIAEAA